MALQQLSVAEDISWYILD